jgi:Tfp pilus assembly protein PilO
MGGGREDAGMNMANNKLAGLARGQLARVGKDPRLTSRLVLGLLLVANLTAAAALLRPWGGSPEQLQRQLITLRAEQQQRQTTVARLNAVVQNVERTRAEADRFLETYFLDRQSAYSEVLGELQSLADKAGVKAKDHSFSAEPIEGSSTLGIVTITGNYEGTYADLIQFVSAIDRSPRFLTIDRLQAAPLQGQGSLAISMRLNVFIRGEGGAQ